jgi:hypothetical protein
MWPVIDRSAVEARRSASRLMDLVELGWSITATALWLAHHTPLPTTSARAPNDALLGTPVEGCIDATPHRKSQGGLGRKRASADEASLLC